MKKIHLIFILLFVFRFGFSQTTEIPFNVGNNKYSITLEKNSGLFKFTLQDSEGKVKKEFSMNEFDGNFNNLFYRKIKEFENNISIENSYAISSNLLFRLTSNNEKPIAGKLFVSKKVYVYDEKNNKIGELKIDNITCVIQQGFIQDFKVTGKFISSSNSLKSYNNSTFIFTNIYGIGFTSKRNFLALNDQKLFMNVNIGYNPNNLSIPQQKVTVIKNSFFRKRLFRIISIGIIKSKPTTQLINEDIDLYVKLGEVIKYDRYGDIETNDYSPADIKVDCKGGDHQILYKESTFKLFEGRVYSDFAGFNSDSPNGLIQLEIEKKANFYTKRWPMLWYPHLRSGMGFFEYVKPYGGYSKIENNNKYLNPNIEYELENGSTSIYTTKIKSKYTTPIDLLKHQSWILGLDLNVVTFDMPSIKSQLFIDYGASYSSSSVLDSIKVYKNNTLSTGINEDVNKKTIAGQTYSINYWQFYPKATWKYAAEYRYGIDVSYSPKFFYITSDKIDLLGTENKSNQTSKPRYNMSKFINEFEFLGFWRTSPNGKLFFRWRLNFETGYPSNYYNQIQVGYAFNILGNK